MRSRIRSWTTSLNGVDKKTEQLLQRVAGAEGAVRDMNAFTEDMQALERSLMTTIPFRLKSTLDFSGSLARIGR